MTQTGNRARFRISAHDRLAASSPAADNPRGRGPECAVWGMSEQLASVPQSIYDFSAELLNGPPLPLDAFRGQALLIVNTASQCGFTPQYAGLEALYRRYRDRGFVVLGFPCNQFGRQEPGSAAQIGAFCHQNYSVSFPLFAKIDVNGPRAHPLYRLLKQAMPGRFGSVTRGRIAWNFTKFLVRRSGAVYARFGPSTRPESLAGAIEQLLAEGSLEPRAER
jgi:glutathione peroxidase